MVRGGCAESETRKGLIAHRGDDRSRFARRFLHQACQVRDALRDRETTDRADRLLAVGGIDPGADRMRHNQPGEQDEQRLAEQALRAGTGSFGLTTGVNV